MHFGDFRAFEHKLHGVEEEVLLEFLLKGDLEVDENGVVTLSIPFFFGTEYSININTQ